MQVYDETVDHLFVSCPFSREVWNEVLSISSGRNKWEQESLMECLKIWMMDKSEKNHKALPCSIIWGIWLSRNSMIFQGQELVPAQVALKIRICYGGSWKPLKAKGRRIPKEPVIVLAIAWGFFDGAHQGTSGMWGAGAIFSLESSHIISLKYAAGQGTNNRAVWFLLKTAANRGIVHLQVFGDSKLLMDWANNKC